MRFLVDECLPTSVAATLREAGHDAIHVVDSGLAGSPDDEVIRRAAVERRVLVSLDTDFGEILANSVDPGPSVVLFRRPSRRAAELAELLLANLEPILADLERGAFVVIEERRLRIRLLPFA